MSSSSDKSEFSKDRRRLVFEGLLEERGIELPPMTRIPRRDPGSPCLLSLTQEGLWKRCRSGQREPPPNEALMLQFSGPLNVASLTQALNEIVSRHETLRTRFVEVNGEVHQVSVAALHLELPLVDLSLLRRLKSRQMGRSVCRALATAAFNLHELPLIAGSVISLSPTAHLLVLAVSPIVCDGWSRRILVDEVRHCYEAYTAGGPSALDKAAIQHGDFAAWERARSQSGESHADATALRSNAANHLIAESRSSAVGRIRRARRRIRLKRTLIERARKVALAEDSTLAMVLFAAWHLLVALCDGQDVVRVGSVFANRGQADLQRLIAPLSDIVPIGVDLRGRPPFRQVVAKVREGVLDALEPRIGSGIVWARDESELNGTFVIDDVIGMRLTLRGLKCRSLEVEVRPASADLGIVLWRAGGGFEGWIELNLDRFPRERLAQIAGAYERLLKLALSDPDWRPAERLLL